MVYICKGTQKMFYEDGCVMYISIHRYDQGDFYPGTGPMHEVGAGAGAGYNINIPWPHGGVGDKEYLAAFESIVMPIARAFDPQVSRILNAKPSTRNP
jgi:acetoin utilization deacetylase AcuC-like enzyme